MNEPNWNWIPSQLNVEWPDDAAPDADLVREWNEHDRARTAGRHSDQQRFDRPVAVLPARTIRPPVEPELDEDYDDYRCGYCGRKECSH